MKRKVIKQGPATLMISLPSHWVKQCNIHAGDELNIEDKGSMLTVVAHSNLVENNSLTIEIESANKFSKRTLETPYIEGVDELVIKSTDPNLISKVQDETARLLGFEIMGQNRDSITIKNIAQGMQTEINTMIRRIFLTLITSLNDTEKALKENDYESLKQLINAEKVTAKLIHFCLRIINTRGYRNIKTDHFVFTSIWCLEQVFDNYRDIADHLIKTKSSVSNLEIKLFKEVATYIRQLYELSFQFNLEKFYEFINLRNEMLKDMEKIHSSKHNGIFMGYINTIIDKIYHIGIFISQSNKHLF